MKTHQNLHLFAAAILAISSSFLLPVSADAWQDQGSPGDGAPFTGIVTFGDSLSDTGNFFSLTGLPQAPYFEGRLTNGLVWIEYLAQMMEIQPEAVVNYAYAGATTGRSNQNDIPGVIDFRDCKTKSTFMNRISTAKRPTSARFTLCLPVPTIFMYLAHHSKPLPMVLRIP